MCTILYCTVYSVLIFVTPFFYFFKIYIYYCSPWNVSCYFITHVQSCFLLFIWQGSEFAHSVIAHSLFAHFAQIKWATVSNSLRSLKTNEQPWANCSGRSEEMSDHERITQVAQDKWATVSNLLRSLMINERMSDSLQKNLAKKI